LSGHVASAFPYIALPLDYILPELLKNAVRATIEAHPESAESALPPVHVTIANNEIDFILRYLNYRLFFNKLLNLAFFPF
jgi:[3-methyl-2-oxobutanoate dehydrogenase (acetyl-transferring)] kinase